MPTISQRIALEGGEEIRRQLQAMGKAGAASFEQIEAAGIKAAQGLDRVVNSVARVERSFVALNASARAFGSSLSSAGQAFGTFEGAILRSVRNIGLLTAAVGGAAVGFGALVKGAADAADNVGEQAAGLGLTTDRYQEFAAAATDSGIEQEQFGRGLGNLAKIIKEDAEKALKDAAEQVSRLGLRFPRTAAGAAAFAAEVGKAASRLQAFVISTGQGETTLGRLGIRTVDAAGNLRNVGDVFLDVADAVAKLPPGVEKTALVMELFGARMGRRFVDMLDKGAEGIKELGKQFAALKFTPEEIKIGDEFAKQFGILDLVITRARQKLALLFGPSFTSLMDAFSDRLLGSFEGIHAGLKNVIDQQIAPVIADLITLISGEQTPIRTDWVRNLEANFARAGQVIDQAVGIIGVAFQALRAAAASIAGVINNIFGTSVSGDALLVAAAILKVTGVLSLFISGLTLAGAAGLLFVRTLGLVLSGLRLLAVGLAAFGVINPFGAIVVAIGLLVLVFATSSDEIKKIWTDLWAELGPIAIEGVRAIGLQIKQALVDALSGPWLTLEVGGKEIFKFAPIVKSADEAGQTAGDTFAQRFAGTAEPKIESFVERIKRLFIEGMAGLGIKIDPTKLNEITSKTSNLTETLKRLGITADSVQPKFKAAGHAGSLAFNSVKEAAEDAANKIRDINLRSESSMRDLRAQVQALVSQMQQGGDTTGIEAQLTAVHRKMRELAAERRRQVEAVAEAEQRNVDAIKRYNAELAFQLRLRGQGGPEVISAPTPGAPLQQRLRQGGPQIISAPGAEITAPAAVLKPTGPQIISAPGIAPSPTPVPPTVPTVPPVAAPPGVIDTTTINTALTQLAASITEVTTSLTEMATKVQGLDLSNLSSIATAVDSLNTIISSLADSMQSLDFSGMTVALSEATAAAQQLGTDLQNLGLSEVAAAMQEVVAAANSAALALSNIQAQGGDGGFATGGQVFGRPGRDKVPAYLTRDEWVMRTAAVKKYGLSFMRAVNEGRFKIPKFNFGGLVEGLAFSLPPLPMSRLADGGLVAAASGRAINLTINNGASKESFRMWADADVAEKVVRYAVSRQAASAGRKSGAFD